MGFPVFIFLPAVFSLRTGAFVFHTPLTVPLFNGRFLAGRVLPMVGGIPWFPVQLLQLLLVPQ